MVDRVGDHRWKVASEMRGRWERDEAFVAGSSGDATSNEGLITSAPVPQCNALCLNSSRARPGPDGRFHPTLLKRG